MPILLSDFLIASFFLDCDRWIALSGPAIIPISPIRPFKRTQVDTQYGAKVACRQKNAKEKCDERAEIHQAPAANNSRTPLHILEARQGCVPFEGLFSFPTGESSPLLP
jgi:hypothetical protein